MGLVGSQIVVDIEEARSTPIQNLPPGTRGIKIRKRNGSRRVRFYVRTDTGIAEYVGVRLGASLELLPVGNANARRAA